MRYNFSSSTFHARVAASRVRLFFLISFVTIMAFAAQAHSNSEQQLSAEVESGLSYLIGLCSAGDNVARLDMNKAAQVAAFILQAPEMAPDIPCERNSIRGSFIAYTIKRPLSQVIRFAYNGRIPDGAINPSSINYSYWKELPGEGEVLPDLWKVLGRFPSDPLVARGVLRESIAPDLHTGAYYEYDLQRAFLVYRQGSMRVVVSLSNQLGDSEVGRKGFIVGSDKDWNYLYTQDQGLSASGLGWVKSKIYNFFSVCFYIEDDNRPGTVKIGVFQWIGAGWVGINMVDSHHIQNGLKRYAEQFKGMLESDRMPDPTTLERVYTALNNTQEAVLREKALDVTRHIKQKAQQDAALKGKSAIREMDEGSYIGRMEKEQLISMLMREFVKYCLGKETPLSSSFWVALKQNASPGRPLS